MAATNRRKLALIIGNCDYHREENKLNDSIQNTIDLITKLNEISFIVTEHIDVKNEDEMMEKVKDFAKDIKENDFILFYFSGHACQITGENYLLPIGDSDIDSDDNLEDLSNNFQRIFERLANEKTSHTAILILDCCRPYVLNDISAPKPTTRDSGLCRIKALPQTFIQFSCAANQTTKDDLFIENLLENISQKNVDVRDLFRCIADNVAQKRPSGQQPLSIDGLSKDRRICLNRISSLPDIPYNAIWKSDARSVSGNSGGPGNTMNRLHCPKGIWVGKNQTIVIADSLNHRIMKYDQGDTYGLRIAGKNISGYSPELLNEPTNVIFHAKLKSYIICDYQNRRVLQLFRRGKQRLKTIIQNIACFGLAVDDEGSIYVSDTERHEVRRYKPGRKHGKIVAGGHGQGRRLHQLNHPTYICIGDDQSVYVSDSWNDRVVRWDKGAKKGVIVAGGHGKGKNRNQLDYPAGVLVDQLGAVYVADHYNYRVMRWRNSECGEVIAGGYFSENYPNKMRGPFLSGNFPNQLNGPEGLAFDQAGNLYVADSNNHRIQRFKIQTS